MARGQGLTTGNYSDTRTLIPIRFESGMPVYAETDAVDLDVELADVTNTRPMRDTPDHNVTSRAAWAVMPDQSANSVTTTLRSWTRDELADVLRVLKPKGKLIVT